VFDTRAIIRATERSMSNFYAQVGRTVVDVCSSRHILTHFLVQHAAGVLGPCERRVGT